MTQLMIKDLAVAADLDAAGMSAVRGGCAAKPSYSCYTPSYYTPSCYMPSTPSSYAPGNVSLDVSQMIGQSQNVQNNNGNNVAFASGISSTVNPTQSAHNNIGF